MQVRLKKDWSSFKEVTIHLTIMFLKKIQADLAGKFET